MTRIWYGGLGALCLGLSILLTWLLTTDSHHGNALALYFWLGAIIGIVRLVVVTRRNQVQLRPWQIWRTIAVMSWIPNVLLAVLSLSPIVLAGAAFFGGGIILTFTLPSGILLLWLAFFRQASQAAAV